MAICKLCREDRTLCNSHIIPDFLFKRLLDGDGTFDAHSTNEDVAAKKFFSTFSEKLLCKECEQRFAEWEGYVSNQIFNDDGTPKISCKTGTTLVLSVDYAKVKLFQMSMLWRFGVSTAPFYPLDLGPHEERLRKMLLASDPGEDWRYACTTSVFTLSAAMGGRWVGAFIKPPEAGMLLGHRAMTCVVCGAVLSYFISGHRAHQVPASIYLTSDGKWPIHEESNGPISNR